MDHIGEKCSFCGEVFNEDDDIVVCPECGSPHHRECYKKNGRCANEDKHGSGWKWLKTSAPKEKVLGEDEGIIICRKCRCVNSADSDTCMHCGAELRNSETGETTENASPVFGVPRPYLGFDPEEDMGGASLKDVSDFVRTNTIYYIPIFKRMKDTGRSISFNLISFIFPPLYFANRKMWFWAILTLILSALLTIPFTVSYVVADGIESGYSAFPVDITDFIYSHKHIIASIIDICNAAYMLMRVLFCLFSNKLYFKFVVKSIRKIRARRGKSFTSSDIAYAGGVKLMNSLLVLLIFVATTLVMTYLTFVILQFLV
ncbi:MAG: hypothetical protein K5979_02845 [Ruminococcus sp.]|nr:hypothetical protein [Ruminococcus sp.]